MISQLPILNECGVYAIHFGKRKYYVGSSFKVRGRMNAHISALKKGTSHCTILQKAFNKYGVDKLVLVVLEYCDKAVVREREIHWMEELNSLSKGYNVAADTTAPMTGRKHSAETKVLMSKKSAHNKANLGKKFTEEHKRKISQADRKPYKKHSVEAREANRLRNSDELNPNSKPIQVRNIENDRVYHFDSVAQFCRSISTDKAYYYKALKTPRPILRGYDLVVAD